MEAIAALVVSVLALLVSVGSVFYTKRASEQTAWANRVNLHEPRKLVYEGLVLYRHLFGDYDIHPNDKEIQNFFVSVAMPARLYFSADIADEIYAIYKLSFELYKRIDDAESNRSSESKWEPINEFKKIATSRIDKIIPHVIAASELGNT